MNSYHLLLWMYLSSICMAWLDSFESQCTNLILQVSATANNLEVNIQGDYNNVTVIVEFLKDVASGSVNPTSGVTHKISGTYNISARYCKPTQDFPGLDTTIQLLVHGATYNKGYWSALRNHEFSLHNSSRYSWVNFANGRGYHTLAIDRLGGGTSSRPDPIKIVQASYEVEIIHQIVQQLRHGKISGTNFSKVIYVGHSYGSILGGQLAATYPSDLNSIILTGFGAIQLQATANAIITAFTPATVARKEIFFGLPPGFLTTSNATLRSKLFYADDYDPIIPILDFAVEDTVTIGELVAIQPTNASEFTGNVLVLTGSKDALICPEGCSAGDKNVLAQVSTSFPAAKSFEYYELPATGHDINLHSSACDAFSYAHMWLYRKEFRRSTIVK